MAGLADARNMHALLFLDCEILYHDGVYKVGGDRRWICFGLITT